MFLRDHRWHSAFPFLFLCFGELLRFLGLSQHLYLDPHLRVLIPYLLGISTWIFKPNLPKSCCLLQNDFPSYVSLSFILFFCLFKLKSCRQFDFSFPMILPYQTVTISFYSTSINSLQSPASFYFPLLALLKIIS